MLRWAVPAIMCVVFTMMQLGCEVDSYFDPSRTGRFMHTPTTIPILENIDVIEQGVSPWGETTEVTPEDLMPSDLTYILSPGDFLTVEIYEGFAAGQWRPFPKRIDAMGNFRIPDLGDVPAAGLTIQEFEDLVRQRMAEELVIEPQVNVFLEDGTALTYTLDGFVAAPGMYQLRRADFRLSEAMAVAGGFPRTARKIYVIRRVALTEEIKPSYDRDRRPAPDRQPSPNRRPQPVDIEDLIEQLPDQPPSSPGMMSGSTDSSYRMSALRERSSSGAPSSVGAAVGELDSAHAAASRMPIDIDDLAPVRPPRLSGTEDHEPVDPREQLRDEPGFDSFIYDAARREWVRTRVGPSPRRSDAPAGEPPMTIERIIEIPAEPLRRGAGQYDIVIRPKDRIVIEGPETGVVYLSGEVVRTGVYTLPLDGTRATLSRVVVAAGDLGGLAIPERVDLVRQIGPHREAVIRLDLAAIRRRTEPDIYMKPNDHVIIGTSWFALPLAVIRNGFRATYGFGFLLDRNFGNDVFGPPPVSGRGGF